MHTQTLSDWQHAHRFTIDSSQNERKTKIVIALTGTMMIVEIAAGMIFGSMALLADGWHMGTHMAALTITVFTYIYARKHLDDPQFSFGTGKMGALGGFASAVALAVIALMMALESVERFFAPREIQLDQALMVAVIGLIVNLLSALILQGHEHGHGHGHAAHPEHHEHEHHEHEHHEHENHEHDDHEHEHETAHAQGETDHNLKSAYMHVLADALTSVLAIAALLAGKLIGWLWLDTMMGFVGAAVITWWAYTLVRDTSAVLLDSGADEKLLSNIRSAIESDADNRVTDLHVWCVGANYWAAVIAIATHYPQSANHYKELLSHLGLAHVSLEVNLAPGQPCITPKTPVTPILATTS